MDEPAGRQDAMRFSVVIPLYNKFKYIGAAVQSVLSQTRAAHEIVVVDDGSTDGGADLVAGFRDPRIRLHTQANQGVAAARNRGIELATGNWIVFLDADDWHHPDLLFHLARAHRYHPPARVIGALFQDLPESAAAGHVGWSVESAPLVEVIRDLYAEWMKSPPFFTSSVAIRADHLRSLQPCFQPGERHGEDLDLWFRAADESDTLVIRAPLAGYRRTDSGLAAGNAAWRLPPYLDRLQQRADSWLVSDPRRRSARRWMAHQQLTAARAAISSGMRRDALRLLARVPPGVLPLRWSVTTAMTVLPPGLVPLWERWRSKARQGRRPEVEPIAPGREQPRQDETRGKGSDGPLGEMRVGKYKVLPNAQGSQVNGFRGWALLSWRDGAQTRLRRVDFDQVLPTIDEALRHALEQVRTRVRDGLL